MLWKTKIQRTGVTAQEKLGSKINDTVLSLATCTKCINFSN